MRVIYGCAASSEGCGLQGVYAKEYVVWDGLYKSESLGQE